MWFRPLLALCFLLAAPSRAAAECLDTATNDCDGDGFATSDGDCDDDDPEVHPGGVDGCDGIDNDCNGRVDEDCDEPLKDATLGGGSACDTAPGAAWLGLGALLLARRRR